MGRGRKGSSSSGKKTSVQAELEQFPLLKKPLELIGKTINVTGDYYEGKLSDEERRAAYLHIVTDHSALHKFAGGKMQEAFQLKEMGESGTGSLEVGVNNSKHSATVHSSTVHIAASTNVTML